MPVASSITEMDLLASETLLEDYHQRARRFRRRIRRRVRDLANNAAPDLDGDGEGSSDDNGADEPVGDGVNEPVEPGVAQDVNGQNVDLNEAIPDAEAFEGAVGADDDWSFDRIDEAKRLDHLEQILLKENREFILHC